MGASPIPFAADVRPDDNDDGVNDERAFRFFYASRGVMGYLVKLLRTALKLAISNPKAHPVIDRPLLERAFTKAFSTSRYGLENPFKEEFKWRVPNGKPGGLPNLPPPLADDRAPLASVRRRSTKKDRARAARTALSK
ncbi:hypothetical protein [Roseomonas xinghualingensis]|uniref:hypothetical protein n=1 Tax=Roseomonas xinghualingensis TaxID=2986475 RepID=UPI0021F1071A|nr:hypothetical protein [Roseomonas sp. SXEYE001]MCV4209751.1 hypothetical protein [Roseomonas sp. SXEYE001]